MYTDEINVTAYNSDSESYRLVRLQRVIGYLCALADHYGNENLLSKISELHDHKGELTVKFNTDLTDGEKEIITKAWLSGVGDGADNVVYKSA